MEDEDDEKGRAYQKNQGSTQTEAPRRASFGTLGQGQQTGRFLALRF